MSNLLATILSSSRALRVYDRVLDVTQNNVANASTPGYVRQRLTLEALPFNDGHGTLGGVWAQDLETARNEYGETTVRQRSTQLGYDAQAVENLTALESAIGTMGDSGIAAALSNFYDSMSNWGVAPNDSTAREQVLARAGEVSAAFRQTAATVGQAGSDAEHQIGEAVAAINSISAQIQKLNRQARHGGAQDPGIDAGLHAAVEELSQYLDFSALWQEDGSVTVLAGGTPLVVGENRYDLAFSMQGDVNGTAGAAIAAADGTDITSRLTSGRLGALVDFRNRVVAGIAGGPGQTGSLNELALSFADRVNAIFTSGVVTEGPPQVAGSPLFYYDALNSANAAATLDVNGTLAASDLAAIDPGPPYVSNGISLRLAALATPTSAEDRIGNLSFTEFFGQIGGGVGRALEDAGASQEIQQSLVAQAKDMRDQVSGVSLDEEATILMQFQRSYQAMSRMIQVLNDLTQEALNILR